MGWFSRKEPPGRKEFREEFRTVTQELLKAEPTAHMAVGFSINLAYKMFVAEIGGVEAFQASPQEKQHEYLKRLSAMEAKLLGPDRHSALGFGLFKMWLGAISAKDDELAAEFNRTLATFSRKGDLGI